MPLWVPIISIDRVFGTWHRPLRLALDLKSKFKKKRIVPICSSRGKLGLSLLSTRRMSQSYFVVLPYESCPSHVFFLILGCPLINPGAHATLAFSLALNFAELIYCHIWPDASLSWMEYCLRMAFVFSLLDLENGTVVHPCIQLWLILSCNFSLYAVCLFDVLYNSVKQL